MNITTLKEYALSLKKDRRGVTAIEYALIAAGIAIVIIAAVQGVGTSLNTVFNKIATSLTVKS